MAGLTRTEKLILAAQVYDSHNRIPMHSWSRVPDDQVLRLLIGAGVIKPEDAAADLPWVQMKETVTHG